MSRILLLLAIVVSSLLVHPTHGQEAAQSTRNLGIPATDDGLPGAGPIRRMDWFSNLWNQRRSQWSRRVELDQKAIVFLGDSITQGWSEQSAANNKLESSFPGLKTANRGISGDTTRGMLIRLDEDVLKLNPSGVVLLMGTNDLEELAEPETVAGNLKLILAALKKHDSKMPIVLCNVFPSSETKKRPSAKIKKINELYAAAVKGDAQVTVVDTWTLFANAAGDAKPEEFPDLLHPNAVGYAKWSAALKPIFATFGFLETEPDSFAVEAGFISLFNGKDLSGWGYRPTSDEMLAARKGILDRDPRNPLDWPVVTAPISFEGQTATPDGRYVAKNGRLIVTTPPEGRKVQQLYSTREFPKDFTLKLEFRATPNADSGVYIRSPQLQCRDYLLAGPYKTLKNYKPQDWNEIVVTVKGSVAHCTCNGEVLEAELKIPATGPIGLEGDRGQMEYRRIRIKEDVGSLLRPTDVLSSWRFEANQPKGKGSMEVKDGTIVFHTTESGDENWHVQAYQLGLDLKEGAKYLLQFKLRSPERVNVSVVGQIHQADWHEIGLHEDISGSPEFTDHMITFTALGVVDKNNRIGFIMGNDKGTLIIKDMTLTEVK